VELFQSIVQRDQLTGSLNGKDKRFIEGKIPFCSAAFACTVGAGVIDQNPSHKAGCDAEKMIAVFPSQIFLFEETDERFVHEAGGLQRVIWPLTTHIIRR
jgi:hypothetical protein